MRQALAFERAWLTSRGLESSVVGNPDWEAALIALADPPHGAGPLSAACLTVRDHAVALGAAGRLSMLAARSAPHIKSLVASLPPALRRVMLRWIKR